MKMSLFQSKRFVLTVALTMCCIAFSVFILGLAIAFNKSPNNNSTSAQYIYGNNSITKLEIIDDITLEDDTIEKLQPKIQVTSTGKQGEFGALVLVTQTHVMFDYILAGKTHSFATMGKDITINDGGSGGGSSSMTISDTKSLVAFRNKVNDGVDDYSGTTVKLSSDINLNNTNWTPIGTSKNPFKGSFDGNNYSIENFKLGVGIYSGIVGLFGCTEGATIKNLNIKNAKIDFTDSTNEYYNEIGAEWLRGYRGIGDLDRGIGMPLTIGFIIGEMNGGTISKCKINSSCSITVKAVSFADLSFTDNSNDDKNQLYQFIGGIVGSAYGTIENCESLVTIDAYNMRQREFCVSGICGGWGNIRKQLNVKNCFFKGKVTITDESDGRPKFNPTFLSYGGMVGGSYRNEYLTFKESMSTVNINNCVAVLDSFQLNGNIKTTAKNAFNNNLKEDMQLCRYSFQPIFSLIPIYRPASKGGGTYNYCGYSDKTLYHTFYSSTTSTNNYYYINNTSNFFGCYADSFQNNKVIAKFTEGALYGAYYNP